MLLLTCQEEPWVRNMIFFLSNWILYQADPIPIINILSSYLNIGPFQIWLFIKFHAIFKLKVNFIRCEFDKGKGKADVEHIRNEMNKHRRKKMVVAHQMDKG